MRALSYPPSGLMDCKSATLWPEQWTALCSCWSDTARGSQEGPVHLENMLGKDQKRSKEIIKNKTNTWNWIYFSRKKKQTKIMVFEQLTQFVFRFFLNILLFDCCVFCNISGISIDFRSCRVRMISSFLFQRQPRIY